MAIGESNSQIRHSANSTWHTAARFRQSLVRLVVVGVLVQSTVFLFPSDVGAEAQSEAWLINDAPRWGHLSGLTAKAGWRGGDVGDGLGYGDGRYFANSNYAYASAVDGWRPARSVALWTFDSHEGVYDVEAFIPCRHATAIVKYHLGYQEAGSYSSVGTKELHQLSHCGWTALGTWTFEGGNPYVYLRYDDSRVADGRSGDFYRSVGMDAVRIRLAEQDFPCEGNLIEKIKIIWLYDDDLAPNPAEQFTPATRFSVYPSEAAESANLPTSIYEQFIACVSNEPSLRHRNITARTADDRLIQFKATDDSSLGWATFEDQLNCHDFPPSFIDASETWDLEGFREPEKSTLRWIRTKCNWLDDGSSSTDSS